MFTFLIIIPFTIYIIGLIAFIIGNLKIEKRINQNFHPNISVIIAVRNGEQSIKKMLDCLKKQIYKGKIEFIIVDDESTDKTKIIINNFCEKNSNFKYISSLEGNYKYKFKKKALDAGIKKSNYDYLLFTDVDCRPNKYWVSSMASHFQNNVEYIVGPISVKNPENFVSLYQSIDLDMLIASLQGITSLGFPCASTGQNQGFKKSIYNKVSKFDKIQNLLGGDDSLFLNIVRNNQGKIKFVSNKNAVVFSRHENKIKNLINQRMRWALDANLMYKFNFVFYILIVCSFLANLIILILPLIHYYSLVEIRFLIISKFIFEMILFGLSKGKNSIINFIFWFSIQPLYVVIIAIYSIFVKDISWKDRKYVN